jgi:ferredoxin-NADP reductase
MQKQFITINSITRVTHDTLSIKTDKPENYKFEPGQATSIALGRDGWQNVRKPYTFSSLPEDDYLEFIIKTYPEHDGATDKLLDMKPGEQLILYNVFGAIKYRGEGVFIAGGSGVTPFISILRDLRKKNLVGGNKLIFANRTSKDIILKDELSDILGDNFINILSEEKANGFAYGFITKAFLKENIDDFNKIFYLCGPPIMVLMVENYLTELNVEKKSIVKEAF